MQHANTSPSSYYSINRRWKNGDKIKLVFHYDFHIQTMPNDTKVVAIFYGPNLLAFEIESELIFKRNKGRDPEKPVNIR